MKWISRLKVAVEVMRLITAQIEKEAGVEKKGISGASDSKAEKEFAKLMKQLQEGG